MAFLSQTFKVRQAPPLKLTALDTALARKSELIRKIRKPRRASIRGTLRHER